MGRLNPKINLTLPCRFKYPSLRTSVNFFVRSRRPSIKMISYAFSFFLFEPVVNALAHDLPRQTSARGQHLIDSNRILEPTAAPRIPPDLRRRQDDLTTVLIGPDQTCGFISGLAGAGHNCDASDYCVMYPATATGFGSVACCDPETNDCTVVTTCIDSSDYYSATSLCDNGCRLDTNTLKW
jgi:hypothetical protein